MKKIITVIVCIVLIVNTKTKAQLATVQTKNGLVVGQIQSEVAVFKGIPFAAPPIGKLRWQAPQPVQNWTGVKQCTAFSASPIQPTPKPFYCWSVEFIAPPQPLSEDCLYLNVWSAAKKQNEKRPVFVWIYGGGFSSGSSACAIYDGVEMAKKGIIFVSINYRVGVMGFLAHPALSKEQQNTSGNYGILDQIAALKWVKQNISAFGGDPNNVTIAGQSAGSMSVNCLAVSALAKGLFHKVIAQSGGLLSSRFVSSYSEAEKVGLAFQQKAKASSLQELRAKSAQEILEASQNMENMRFAPNLDGQVLPKNILACYQNHQQNDVPLMTGWVLGDAGLMGGNVLTTSDFKKISQEKYKEKGEGFLSIFKAETDQEAKESQNKLSLLSFAGLPSHLWAGFNKSKSYLYQFTKVPPIKPNFPDYGAFHTSEVPYALHTLHTWQRDWQANDKALENIMSDYWVNFAKTGNPNGSGLPVWNAYDKAEGIMMVLGDKVEQQKALLKKELDYLEKNQ